MNTKKFGAIIKRERMSRNMSQEVTSSFADIGRTHLSAIERGDRVPTLTTFIKLSFAMDMRPSELLGIIEDELGKEIH